MINILILLATIIAVILLTKYMIGTKKALKKYQAIIDLENEVQQRTKESDDIEKNLIKLQGELSKKQEEVDRKILGLQKRLDEVTAEIRRETLKQQEAFNVQKEKVDKEFSILNETGNLVESGFYTSKYDFEGSRQYEEKLDQIRDKLRQMIRDKIAITCPTEWRVGDSRAEGKKMTDRTIKLGLSAFNVQCDNEILKVKFDNIDRASEKIYKIQEVVNKLLEPNHCTIQREFVALKLEELHLAYEYQQQAREEKEEQRELREQMRDEEKARREAERFEAEAIREENRYAAALVKARTDLESKSDDEKEFYLSKILDLELKLKEAQDNKERAKSLAEQTRMGHVYIISNIGSFGENVFKIGMTRRLDPMDRIDELGDASVPFEFDVHAIIKTDDAPKLEKFLHQSFADKRVNMINMRKEFFRASLVEIESQCKKAHKDDFKITLLATAQEYRQTIARLKAVGEEKKAA